MIPESFIQELLARVDVADVVGRYVQLRKGGANLIGLCPFHNEKSPSFTVSPSKQFYHCFGCGAHGSAISFLMAHTGATFPEAVRSLAAEVGLTVPESQRSARQREQDRARQAQRSIHHQLLDTAQAHYERQLASYAPAQQYLAQRGLSAQTIQRFGLGWVGPERQGLQRVFPNYDEAVMVEAGLVVEADDGRRYDRFRARLMFPIRNRRGDIVGFGGRLIAPGEPKYLNSPETPLFSKSHELYGLYENRQGIRQEGVVTVVEGYMDVVALANAGLHNAVATLGTATTEFHIRQLMRASDRIVFCFDGDTAGKRAAWRALTTCLTMLRDDVSLRFLFLPAEHDPDSYVAVYGAEAFRQQLQQSVALSRFMLDELAARHPMEEAEGRAACVHEALPLLQNLSDSTLSLQIKQEFAQLVRLTDEELAQRLTPSLEPATDVWAAPVAAPETSKRQGFTSQRAVHSVTPIAKQLLKLLAGNPELAQDLDHEALEIIVQSPTLVLVQELIVLANNTQSKHIGALLEAMDSDSDLAPVLEGLAEELVQQDDLPNPKGEWSDALRKLQVEAIKQEQSRLIDAGLPDSASRQRYQDLSKRLVQLMAAASP